jgi:alpha-amylase
MISHWCATGKVRRLSDVMSGICLALSVAACSSGQSPSASNGPPKSLPTVDVSHVSVANTASALPDGWQHGAFMEIFVRGYSDSDGDGIGDLKGLTERLDYLQALGITGLWLMPINPSEDRDHGYAVTDYRSIEPAYGTIADFDELLRQAHARGIGVVMDYVINHSASQHPLFLQAKSSTTNPFRDWYVWQSPAPNGWSIFERDPWRMTATGAYLAQFSETMPDFNFRNADALAFHHDNLRFWLNRGVDGFRFDAVAHLVENGPKAWMDQPENYTLIGDVQSTVKQYQRRYMVCEGTANSIGYGAPNVCGSAFAFGHNEKIVAAARGDVAAVNAVATYFQSAPHTMATFVANHDAFAGVRLWDQFGGDIAQYKLAAATYLLLPGVPFIYYGEEIGMSAAVGLRGDPALRGPMSWTSDPVHAGFSNAKPYRPLANNVTTHNVAAALTDSNSLLAFYKAMIALRKLHPSISRGSYDSVISDGASLSFQRKLNGDHAVIAINYGKAPSMVTISALPASASVKPVFPAAGSMFAVGTDGRAQVSLPAQSVSVWVVTKP